MKIKYLLIYCFIFLVSNSRLMAAEESGIGGGHYSEDSITETLNTLQT